MRFVGMMAGVALLLCSQLVHGQTPAPEPKPAAPSVPIIFHSALSSASAPAEKGGWEVRIVSRGGFSGMGRGDIIVESSGRVICANVEGACRDAISGEPLRALAAFVKNAQATEWGAPKLGYCSDCFSTMLILKRREENGELKTLLSYWDDTTWGEVHAKGFPLFDALMKALKK